MCDAHTHCLLLFIKWTFQTTNEQERKLSTKLKVAIRPIATVLSIAIQFSSHWEMRFFSLATLFFVCHSLFCLLFSRSFSTLRFRLNQVHQTDTIKSILFSLLRFAMFQTKYTHTPKYTQSLTLTRCLFSCFVLIRRLVYLCVCCIRSFSFIFV